MAHANPEFALGLMRREASPVRFQTRAPASFGQLQHRMRVLISVPAEERTPAQQRQIDLYATVTRQQRAQDARARQLTDAIAEPVGGMHAGGKIGERFVEPRRRIPQDVQAGREKVRRGTLPR